jgi:hypothetical protein
VTLTGNGFNRWVPANNKVTVCGLPAEVVSATYTSLTVRTPRLIDEYSRQTLKVGDLSVLDKDSYEGAF